MLLSRVKRLDTVIVIIMSYTISISISIATGTVTGTDTGIGIGTGTNIGITTTIILPIHTINSNITLVSWHPLYIVAFYCSIQTIY